MKKWNNPWTRAVVALAIVACVAVAFVVVWAVRGAWVLFALELAVAVAACVVLGVLVEKSSAWLWQKVQEETLRDFLEFARANCRAQGVATDGEPFEEFLRREGESEKGGKE